MVCPLPRLIATCASSGRPPPGVGSLEKWNSSAPGVLAAWSTGISRPLSLRSRYWLYDVSGMSTPTWWAAHSVSFEQSKVVGFGSLTSTSAPKT